VTGAHSETAVVVKRVDSGEADTAEFRDLARAAGYEVVSQVTQTRKEDPAYCIGEGKVQELAQVVVARSMAELLAAVSGTWYLPKLYGLGGHTPGELRSWR